MATNRISESQIRREVERLFDQISAKRGDLCTNPVIGGDFEYGVDPLEVQKNAAYKRLLAREYCSLHAPPDAPLMPTDDYELSRAKYATDLLGFITAQFLWSLEYQDDLRLHPAFADFVSGLLWQDENQVEGCSLPHVFPPEKFVALKKRVPPRELEGLNHFYWRSPHRRKQPRKAQRAA